MSYELSPAIGQTHYASRADLESWLGSQNVKLYSDIENANATNAARVDAALTRADNQIDRAFRQRGYAAPLAGSSLDYATVSHIAVRLAAYWLYSARDFQDASDVVGDAGAIIKANTWRRRALDEMNQLLLNGIDCGRNTDAPTVPTAI